MHSNSLDAFAIFLVFLTFILFAGNPNLLEALIHYLMEGKCET